MEQKRYITEEESAGCRRVAHAFAELYEEGEVLVLDAGRYGFLELQYFREDGFESNRVFRDSRELFEELWEIWMDVQLMKFAKGTPMQELDYEDIFKCLPEEKQGELAGMRSCFASRAGIGMDGIHDR